MTISRMQQPRQMYGLGSFVKKAVKGVKDFVKSDAGKALGLAALSFGIPGTQFGGLFGRAGFGGAATGLFGKQGIGATLGAIPGASSVSKFLGGEKTFGKTAAMFGLGGLGAAALQAAGLDTENPNEMPRDVESLKGYLRSGYLKLNPGARPEDVDAFVEANTREYSANGGRIGYNTGSEGPDDLYSRSYKRVMELMDEGYDFGSAVKKYMEEEKQGRVNEAYGGRIGYAFGDVVDQASGIMGLPQRVNQAGVKELDLRETGGFIPPVGVKEKADDIPAMLSNNEFVFTAKSVKEMGDGNVNKGAQRMYDMMKYLEKGGRV
jgi:hypothetical protein